jgi:predicted CXXCH cytochrome family protein
MIHLVRCRAWAVTLAVVSMGLVVACGDDKKESDDDGHDHGQKDTSSVLSFADIDGILTTDCKSCHSAAGGNEPLTTEAEVTALKDEILERIALKAGQSLAMPPSGVPAGSAYESTANGAQLKLYLQGL